MSSDTENSSNSNIINTVITNVNSIPDTNSTAILSNSIIITKSTTETSSISSNSTSIISNQSNNIQIHLTQEEQDNISNINNDNKQSIDHSKIMNSNNNKSDENINNVVIKQKNSVSNDNEVVNNENDSDVENNTINERRIERNGVGMEVDDTTETSNRIVQENNRINNNNNNNTRDRQSNASDISLESNALADIMNTYSSDSMDEDMFVEFRNKNDENKSDDEESCATSILSANEFVDNSSDEEEEEEKVTCAPKKGKGVKMKSSRNNGELDLDDLPPIEDLHISVPENLCLPVGTILNIVDTLVLIKSLKNTPTLDLDSVLFLDKGQRSLGKIFDVIGPITSPVYCVRFNSNQHIIDSNIQIDQSVYCAPQTDYTSYVPLPDLIRGRGSDASWEKDREPPPEVVEFSDDEEERRFKRANTNRARNNRANQTDVDEAEPKSKRPTPFEQRMNIRNLLMTASYERRNRINDTSSTKASKPLSNPNASIIRVPTLPDIPPLPQPTLSQGTTSRSFTGPRFHTPEVNAQVRFGDVSPISTNHNSPPRLSQHMNNPQMGMYTPSPIGGCFHQNGKRPPSVSPFSNSFANQQQQQQQQRFIPPFSPPMFNPGAFTNLPPPPMFNEMLVFSPPPPVFSPPPFPAPQWSPAPQPSLPFQFGMPPLIGPNFRLRHNNPRPPLGNMRPKFNSRSRF